MFFRKEGIVKKKKDPAGGGGHESLQKAQLH